MYRRLKNILGVSLIILAVLIAQMPMPETQAEKAFTVTFSTNGGSYSGTYNGYTFKKQVPVLVLDGEQRISDFPSDSGFSYDGYLSEDGKWYTDMACLTEYDKSNKVKESITLYKKWYNITSDGETPATSGFYLNPDKTVLYKYDGADRHVEIPDTVTTIAAYAFEDLSGVRGITLPSNIVDVRENAFGEAQSSGSIIYIYDTDTAQSMSMGRMLDDSYDRLVYSAYLDIDTVEEIVGIDYGERDTTKADGKMEAAVKEAQSDAEKESAEADSPETEAIVAGASLSETKKMSEAETVPQSENGVMETNSLEPESGVMETNSLEPENGAMEANLSEPEAAATEPELSEAEHEVEMEPVAVHGFGMAAQAHVRARRSMGTLTERQAEVQSIVGKVQESGIQSVNALDADTTAAKSDVENMASMETKQNISPTEPEVSAEDNTAPAEREESTGDVAADMLTNIITNDTLSGGASACTNAIGSRAEGFAGNAAQQAEKASEGVKAAKEKAAQEKAALEAEAALVDSPAESQRTVTRTAVNSASEPKSDRHVKDSTPKTGDALEYRMLLVCCLFCIGVLLLLTGNGKKRRTVAF